MMMGFKGIIQAVKEAGKVADKFVRTPDEKDELMAHFEDNISKRWEADSRSESYLTRNIRPLLAVWSATMLTILTMTDGNIGDFKINPAYLPIYQSVCMTIIGGYFVLRTIDKKGKIK